ncbi:hypothetical protein RRG08_022467 [Elysia crispata]|uniref:PiggyBac transposable element-derived protein domain-containing protein n=1 Tax=Elysia crispata TaxID=231223 RepID=A0AAE0Z1J8_9GAST|nr:hypothetical protein RRG08_022467 [Elysia crispata]
MPDVSAIDKEVADTEWMDVSPDFTPQRHDFSGGGGINFDDTDFKEIDYQTIMKTSLLKMVQIGTDSTKYSLSCSIFLQYLSGKDDPVTNLDNDIPQECRDMSVTAKTTLALMKKFLNKGYHLFIDNWYTSVPLLEFLHGMQTMCTGTARANRVPRELKNSKVPKGQIKSMTKGPLLTQKFEDKKTVYMKTTSHGAETVSKLRHGGQERTIPKSIDTYNKNMGGVDRIDQILEPYDATRKTVRWYVKLAIHLIQIAILNGWTLFRKRGGQKDFYTF